MEMKGLIWSIANCTVWNKGKWTEEKQVKCENAVHTHLEDMPLTTAHGIPSKNHQLLQDLPSLNIAVLDIGDMSIACQYSATRHFISEKVGDYSKEVASMAT